MKETRHVEECLMDSSSWRASTQRAICEEVFGEKQHSNDGTSAYSPDLAPCDFSLFPKIKSALKGTRFESVDAVKAKATQLLNSLTQDDLQHCFQQRKIRMERCRDRGGDYIEGDNISIVWFFFNKGLEHESGFFIATPPVWLVIAYISVVSSRLVASSWIGPGVIRLSVWRGVWQQNNALIFVWVSCICIFRKWHHKAD